MEFVVIILEQIFHKTRDEATRIMLNVHKTGVGIAGIYTFEIAETKVMQVLNYAQRNQHPLQCIMERE
jgi:ATP-dependent Clp protease adaptor protein ClpS